MRRFIVIGRKATASEEFLLDDLPSTSGRLDILLRCARAALLTSHGLRRDAVVYLVLLGGPRAPRVLRIRGDAAKFIRPDERSLATLAKKTLASRADEAASGFVDVKPGIAIARGGVEEVLADAAGATLFLLDESGEDLRAALPLAVDDLADVAFFLGDHHGLDAATRARIDAAGARPVSIGPVLVHADDVVAIVSNELDRRGVR
jgi:tRNA (pseudouridine54-N1)-methyltransferase